MLYKDTNKSKGSAKLKPDLILLYSGTSISGGARDGNFRVSPHSKVIMCAKKALYYKIFLPLNSTNYEKFV